MAEVREFRRRIVDGVTMTLVAGLSFVLLIYVGFGEANRSYEQFYVGKLTAQAKVLVNAIEGFLKRDLPLDQYVGFRPRAERLLNSDRTVSTIAVFDSRDRLVFTSGEADIRLLPEMEAPHSIGREEVSVRSDSAILQVVLPLKNNRDIVGSIAISMPHDLISRQVEKRFLGLIPIGLGLSIAFGLFVGGGSAWLVRQRWPVLQMAYAGLFLLVAALVIGNLVSLYAKGTQIKTKALADSLGQRMTEVVGFNLDIEQIPGLDRAFSEYRRLNPDIAAAALVIDGTILIHTDSFMVGRPWESDRDVYEYLVDISPNGSERRVNIAVTLPQEIVYRQTLRSVKNFAALFIASAFLASLFLQLAGSVNQRDGPKRGRPGEVEASGSAAIDDEQCLRLVKPVFYVTMCVEHLSYAFLASYIADLISASGLSGGLTPAVFVVYYLCFALTLVPAGHLAQQFSPKPLMICGLLLSASSFLLLMAGDIGLLIAARAAAGIGQAMLFIGVQSFILSVAAPERKTQGAAIIVYGFQGGMISGMAIGSLLVGYVGADGVFAVGAVTTMLTLIYATFLVPAIANASPVEPVGIAGSVKTLGRNVLLAVGNRQLLQAILLIGIPAKAVLTGIVVFAIPLLMTSDGYRQEDIGQILMLYAAAVVIANEMISRWVDRTGKSQLVLLIGALLSGLGLWLIGYLGLGWLENIPYGASLEVLCILIGVIVLGLAHGLINAPIVSHVAGLPVSEQIGVSALTATYRFLERIGHVAGPLLVGQMFLLIGEDAMVLAWSGGAIALFGLIYFLFSHGTEPKPVRRRQPAETHRDQVGDFVGLQLDRQHQAIILTLSSVKPAAFVDPAQAILLQHMRAKGAEVGAGELATYQESVTEALDVSTVVANRRRALRFKIFLSSVHDVVPSDQPLLAIVYSPRLDASRSDLASWLRRRPGSRLVIMTNIGAWLDQMRGWLALLNLDAGLGDERRGAEALMTELKSNLDQGGGELAWIGSIGLGDGGGRSDTQNSRPVAEPTLRAVGE
jgi:predicted MFS family arabinose efflux permease